MATKYGVGFIDNPAYDLTAIVVDMRKDVAFMVAINLSGKKTALPEEHYNAWLLRLNEATSNLADIYDDVSSATRCLRRGRRARARKLWNAR